jgi:alkanesulfonate monooxygenase SsuD/methylene tetrahydromethanopterin reductase-like flavin-dependent oxidoreductase (luciferase family)
VHLGGHHRSFRETLDLVRSAAELGYRAAFVDGDVTVVPSRGEAPVYDGWTTTVAILARTERIEIGSLRLVHHWNPARLAQAVATAETVAPGRLRFLASIGGQPTDRSFGLPFPSAGQRIAWLDEWLGVLRRLWSGETVTLRGRWVALEQARIRPLPRGGRMPIEVAGAGPRLLAVLARHADRWDMNLPPLADPVREAARRLDIACATVGRDPSAIGRSMWIFTRPGRVPDEATLLGEFRRWNPWFGGLSEPEQRSAILSGPVGDCRERIARLRTELGIDLPVLDLVGLDEERARGAMEALAGA